MATLILDMVKLLLAEGAEVNSVARGHSPLSLAIVNSHNEVRNYYCLGLCDVINIDRVVNAFMIPLSPDCGCVTGGWR